MRPEEAQALFEGFDSGRPRRRGRALALLGGTLLVGVAIGAGVYAMRAESRASDAEVARGRAEAERAQAVAARDEAERLAAELAARAEEAAALATRVTEAAEAAARAHEAEVAEMRAATALLRGVVEIAAGGTDLFAPPALHELLRGEVLAQLKPRLSRAEHLALVGAAVRAMSIDVRARDGDAVRADFEFAKGYLSEAQEAYPAESAEMARALRVVAAMCFAYQAIPALDEPARSTLRENARVAAARAAEISRPNGGRPLAEALSILGRLSRIDGDASRAAELLSEARAVFATAGARRDEATALHDLARANLDLGRREEALAQLRQAAATIAETAPFGDALELEVRSLIVSLLSGDERAVMEERLALGRVLVQLGRPALALEVLGHAVRYHARDETRFRERLEGAVWLARALDQLGSTKAALETLDQPRLIEDARIFGRETLLVREYETLRTMLRARVER